jgi:hypothetical protein
MLMPAMLRFRLVSLRPTRESTRTSLTPWLAIDAMFQWFTVIVNNIRANVVAVPYDDHYRAIKLLQSLDCTVGVKRLRPFLSRRSMRP